MMKTSREIGIVAEQLAMNYLEQEGGIILERNYRFMRGEVDIIADLFGVMVFVEVKCRKNNRYGYPEEFLSDAQIDRIHETATEYCERFSWRKNIRFDIISIEGTGENPGITHLKDAF